MGYLLFVHSPGHTVTTSVVPNPLPFLKLINVSLNTGRLSDRSTAALYSCYIPPTIVWRDVELPNIHRSTLGCLISRRFASMADVDNRE